MQIKIAHSIEAIVANVKELYIRLDLYRLLELLAEDVAHGVYMCYTQIQLIPGVMSGCQEPGA